MKTSQGVRIQESGVRMREPAKTFEDLAEVSKLLEVYSQAILNSLASQRDAEAEAF